MSDLTLCSVAYANKVCVELNYDLTCRLNPARPQDWVMVENNAPSSDQRLGEDDPRFRVLAGPASEVSGQAQGSYHHAAALNLALPAVQTRFALALDPDFFIIRPNWIEVVVAYMRREGLSILGAPYHPQYHKFYRYFPGPACLFIDLEKVPAAQLDFRPEYLGLQAVSALGLAKLLALWFAPDSQLKQLNPELTHEIIDYALTTRLLKPALKDILAKTKYPPGWLRDTGFRLARTLGRDPRQRVECLVPAWVNPLFTESKASSLWQQLAPERLSLYPKRRAYTTDKFFRDFGLPDIDGLGWEEYFWQGQPFGFHLRGFSHDRLKFDSDQLRQVVEAFGHSPALDSNVATPRAVERIVV